MCDMSSHLTRWMQNCSIMVESSGVLLRFMLPTVIVSVHAKPLSKPAKAGDLCPFSLFGYMQVFTRSAGRKLAKQETCVRRRYADFVWLRGALLEKCPHSFVPALAGMRSLAHGLVDQNICMWLSLLHRIVLSLLFLKMHLHTNEHKSSTPDAPQEVHVTTCRVCFLSNVTTY